jgi:hypothetical protein
MADNPLKYRDLRRILASFNVEEHKKRGKGSERIFVGIIQGRKRTIPVKCHGEGKEVPAPVIRAMRRRFQLTASDGVSDAEFYSKR